MKRENYERVRRLMTVLEGVDESLAKMDDAEKVLGVPIGKFGVSRRKRLMDRQDRTLNELEML